MNRKYSTLLILVVLVYFRASLNAGQQVSNKLVAGIYTKLSESVNAELRDELLLLQSPGVALRGARFDARNYRSSNYSGESAESLVAKLTDAAPAMSIVHVPRFRNASSLAQKWRQLLANYQWYDAIWQRELCELEALLPPVDELERLQAELEENVAEVGTFVSHAYKLCARQFDVVECTRRNETLWAAMLNAARDERDHVAGWVTVRLAQLNRLHARSGDFLMSQAALSMRASSEAATGNRDAADVAEREMPRTMLHPADWWQWFDDDDENDSAADFRVVEVDFAEVRAWNDSDVEPRYVALRGDYVADRWSLIGGDLVSANADRNATLRFEVALVDIERQWLDVQLLRVLDPLRVRGMRVAQWSDGRTSYDNDGELPLLTTSFLVARNVCLSGADLSSSLLTVPNGDLTSPSGSDVDDPLRFEGVAGNATGAPLAPSLGTAGLVGPFSAQGNLHHFDAGFAGATRELEWQPRGADTVCIDGAQIIGWLARTVPRFPSADELPVDWRPATCPELLDNTLPMPTIVPLDTPIDVTPPLTPPDFSATPVPVPGATPDPLFDQGRMAIKPIHAQSSASSLSAILALLAAPLLAAIVALS
jgi:hypothetical protein